MRVNTLTHSELSLTQGKQSEEGGWGNFSDEEAGGE